MNKSILIGIPIAIIVIVIGIYFVSSGTEFVNESAPEFDSQDTDLEPKKYTQKLTENLSVVAP
jgi:hypothetical protein